MGPHKKGFVSLNSKHQGKNFTLHSNSGYRRGEKIHIFIDGMVCYINTLQCPLPKKKKKKKQPKTKQHQKTNHNYNQLICLLWWLGIIWTCGNWRKIYRRAAGRVCFPFLQQFCPCWGKPEEAAPCKPMGRDLSEHKHHLGRSDQTPPSLIFCLQW